MTAPAPSRPRRGAGRDIARAGVALTAAFVGLTAFQAIRSATAATTNSLSVVAGSGATAGSPITAGTSGTLFSLVPPVGASCTGDTATGGYKFSSYMVSGNVDPTTLTFGSAGPILPAGATGYVAPLYANQSPFINKNTGTATVASGPGLLTGLLPFDFSVYAPDASLLFSPGVYNLGYACHKGTAGPTQLDQVWNIQFTFAQAPNDTVAKMSWVLGAVPPTTTTSTTLPPTTTTSTTLPPTTTTSTTLPPTTTTSTTLPPTTTTSTTLPPTTTTSTTLPPTTTTSTTSPPTTTTTSTTLPPTTTTPTTTTVPGGHDDGGEHYCSSRQQAQHDRRPGKQHCSDDGHSSSGDDHSGDQSRRRSELPIVVQIWTLFHL